MGELWVNYAELADAIGEDGAEKLCRAVGGWSTYIPRTQPGRLSALRGHRHGTDEAAVFGVRRVAGDAAQQEAQRALQGTDRAAAGIRQGAGGRRLEIGVTERYVRMIASRCKIGSGGSGGRGSVCRPD